MTSAIFFALVFFVITAGESGLLSQLDRFPPPIMMFLVVLITTSFVVAYSPVGTTLIRHTPLHQLVEFQSFRLLAEMVIFLGNREGLAPNALCFTGYNFDLLIGASAMVLGVLLKKRSHRLATQLWSWAGIASLINIAFIAMTSMPNSLRLFMQEPSNLWVTFMPYTLLPGILVTAALTGQLLILRKLYGKIPDYGGGKL